MSRKNCWVIFLKQGIRFSQKLYFGFFQTFGHKMTLVYENILVICKSSTAQYLTLLFHVISNYFLCYFLV